MLPFDKSLLNKYIDCYNSFKFSGRLVFEHLADVPGFADAVKHLDGFYNFSQYLNALFFRREFKLSRSTTDLNVADLIGLNHTARLMSRQAIEQFYNHKSVEVPVDFNAVVSTLSADVFKNLNCDSVRNIFTSHVESAVIKCIAEQIDIEVFEKLNNEKFVLNIMFNVRYMTYIGQFVRPNAIIRKLFTKGYFLSKLVTDTFELKDTINVVLHLRRGDTTIFPYTENHYIAAWGDYRRRDNPEAHPDIINNVTDSVYPYVDIDNLLYLLKVLLEQLEDRYKINVVFSSDGFERGLERVIKYQNRLSLSESDILKLSLWTENEKQLILSKVSEFCKENNCQLKVIWGESTNCFKSVFSAIVNANIILHGIGGYASTIYTYYNSTLPSVCLGPCLTDHCHDHVDQIKSIVKSLNC